MKRVLAIATGYYADSIRNVGALFHVPAELTSTWFVDAPEGQPLPKLDIPVHDPLAADRQKAASIASGRAERDGKSYADQRDEATIKLALDADKAAHEKALLDQTRRIERFPREPKPRTKTKIESTA
jgi:hypothetical protein